ncbi:hypothetical protein DL96DRAFT_1766336 [Flagelloscypha sp. PMI_526]|nr:hypothetical protein DL96DRAFT_1766336 [Flagelloscypha sp. PMI_526]
MTRAHFQSTQAQKVDLELGLENTSRTQKVFYSTIKRATASEYCQISGSEIIWNLRNSCQPNHEVSFDQPKAIYLRSLLATLRAAIAATLPPAPAARILAELLVDDPAEDDAYDVEENAGDEGAGAGADDLGVGGGVAGVDVGVGQGGLNGAVIEPVLSAGESEGTLMGEVARMACKMRGELWRESHISWNCAEAVELGRGPKDEHLEGKMSDDVCRPVINNIGPGYLKLSSFSPCTTLRVILLFFKTQSPRVVTGSWVASQLREDRHDLTSIASFNF